MVIVECSDGREFVGDLWRYHDGRLELEPPGESPYVMAFLDVVGVRLLTEHERAQVTPRSRSHRPRPAQRKHGVKGIPATPEAPLPAAFLFT